MANATRLTQARIEQTAIFWERNCAACFADNLDKKTAFDHEKEGCGRYCGWQMGSLRAYIGHRLPRGMCYVCWANKGLCPRVAAILDSGKGGKVDGDLPKCEFPYALQSAAAALWGMAPVRKKWETRLKARFRSRQPPRGPRASDANLDFGKELGQTVILADGGVSAAVVEDLVFFTETYVRRGEQAWKMLLREA